MQNNNICLWRPIFACKLSFGIWQIKEFCQSSSRIFILYSIIPSHIIKLRLQLKLQYSILTTHCYRSLIRLHWSVDCCSRMLWFVGESPDQRPSDEQSHTAPQSSDQVCCKK